ncbi:MAG: Calx-beta domain-containing protein, partial [Chthoniobacteraceae bacterium]
TLDFAPGETSATISISVLGDTIFEADETLSVVLSTPANALIEAGTATGTILNDEPVEISIGDVSAAEGISGTTLFAFPVTLSGASSSPITVEFSTMDLSAVAGSDYEAQLNQTLVFAPGETSKTINVAVFGNTKVEPDKTFSINLSNATNGVLLNSQALGTIVNDDSDIPIIPIDGGVTFTKDDGSQVVVSVSKGALSAANVVLDAVGNIALIDLTAGTNLRAGGTDFSKAKLTVFANGGSGQVDVGAINAMGLNLKSVEVEGDLGRIDIGNGTPKNVAAKKITADSIGFSASPNAESMIAGTVGVMKIKNNVKGVLNVTGGLADDAGLSATVVQAIKKVVIGGNIDGSAGGNRAGLLRVSGDIGSVIVRGSVMGGADLSGIVVGGNAGKIKIGGDLMSDDEAHPVTVSALGTVGVTQQGKAVALKQVQVGGSVVNAEILAGFRRDGTPSNADAGIGKIIVEGNWIASSAAAGVVDATGDGFGINDLLIQGGNAGIVSKVASITIGGQMVSGSEREGDHFGITAQQIGSLTLGRARQSLHVGAGDIIDLTTDFTAVDFA